ncbi:hypothetical protein B9D94_23980 [Paenibacillus sp. Cedars]|nr:hypothetical protein B9D94_23980 [Paenibacillus sp. Cedars]
MELSEDRAFHTITYENFFYFRVMLSILLLDTKINKVNSRDPQIELYLDAISTDLNTTKHHFPLLG